MEEATLSLQWNSHQQTLSGAVESLHLTSPDVSLVCADEGKRFSGNKIALSASSPFFYSLLKDHFFHPEIFIILPDVNSAHFESILAFLHTGTMTIDKNELDAVLVLATQLQIQCFSGTESQKTVKSSGVKSSEELEVESKPVEESSRKEKFKNDDEVINEEVYQNLKTLLMEEKLINENEGWTCLVCQRQWVGDSNNIRRHARRHVESHLQVRFQCLGCGNILKTKESFYFHKSNYCKNSYSSVEPGFQMVLDKGRNIEVKDSEVNNNERFNAKIINREENLEPGEVIEGFQVDEIDDGLKTKEKTEKETR